MSARSVVMQGAMWGVVWALGGTLLIDVLMTLFAGHDLGCPPDPTQWVWDRSDDAPLWILFPVIVMTVTAAVLAGRDFERAAIALAIAIPQCTLLVVLLAVLALFLPLLSIKGILG